MNLDLNVFSSSSGTRYIGSGDQITWDTDLITFDSIDVTFDGGLLVDGSGAYETNGTFDTNTFSSESATRYEAAEEVGAGGFDYTLDFTFE